MRCRGGERGLKRRARQSGKQSQRMPPVRSESGPMDALGWLSMAIAAT